MRLTKEEEGMLQGKRGYAFQKSMELLVAIGDIFGAEKMAEVSSVHIVGGGVTNAGKAWASYIEDLASKGGTFTANATVNPTSADPFLWKEMGVDKELFSDQMKFSDSYIKMGALMGNTCTPWNLGNIPRYGEHIAWGESSAVIFANSIFGARTNREGAPTAVASAITGRTPLYGYHLDQNRFGNVKVIVSANLEDTADYGALGYFVGKVEQEFIPVFYGLPPMTSLTQMNSLGAGLSIPGNITLFHVIGVTPEAKIEEQVLNVKKLSNSKTVEFGNAELKRVMQELSTSPTDEVGLVVTGCPHAPITEIKKVAKLLLGKTVNSSVAFWICTSAPVKAWAERTGYGRIIEESGGKMICGTCPMTSPTFILERMGFNSIATNSAKCAHYLHYLQEGFKVKMHFGTTERCIKAAIRGVWR